MANPIVPTGPILGTSKIGMTCLILDQGPTINKRVNLSGISVGEMLIFSCMHFGSKTPRPPPHKTLQNRKSNAIGVSIHGV
jgi:hypothetical protein